MAKSVVLVATSICSAGVLVERLESAAWWELRLEGVIQSPSESSSVSGGDGGGSRLRVARYWVRWSGVDSTFSGAD